MRRRKFIALAGGAAAWSGVALAQKLKKPARLAFLFFGSPSSPYDRSLIDAFRQGLRQAGLVENQDIVLDIVWVTDPEQAVRDAIQHGADMLIPCGSSTSVVAKRHGSTIPIVFVSVGDPVGMGLVESLSRPGGNVTGFSDILGELSGKLVDVALELSKPQTTVDYLWHTNWPDGQNRYQLTEQAAQSRGVRLRHRGISDIAEINDALAAMRQDGAMTVVIQPSPLTYGNRQWIIDLVMNYRLGTRFAFPVAARPTFRMLRGQFGVNFWLLGYPKGVLWDTQQLENEVLQVGELDVEDLHGLAVLQELVPLGKAEQTQDLFRGGTRAVALLGV